MLERRQHPRNRVYYGGMIAFNARNSTLACVVRNVSNQDRQSVTECRPFHVLLLVLG